VPMDLCTRALGPAAATLGWVYSYVLLGSLIHDLAILRPRVGDPGTSAGRGCGRRAGTRNDCPSGWTPSWPAAAQLALRWHYLPDYPSYTPRPVRVHTPRPAATASRFPGAVPAEATRRPS